MPKFPDRLELKRKEQSPDGALYLTKIMNQDIRFHWRRVGIPVWQVLQTLEPRPDDLTALIVNDWIAHRVQFVNRDDWRAVLDIYSTLPDECRDKPAYRQVGYPPHVDGTTRIEITQDMYQSFMTELKRTGAEVKLDIVDAEHAPEGLNERVIQIFRRQEAKTIRSDYWEFMMGTLAAMNDFKMAR